MQHNPYLYIAVMAGVTYLIRVLPLTLIRREIKNRTIRSFLYYVPYVTLAVMTFPAMLDGRAARGHRARLVRQKPVPGRRRRLRRGVRAGAVPVLTGGNKYNPYFYYDII